MKEKNSSKLEADMLLTIPEVASIMRSTPKTIYTYLCNSKTQKRNKLPKNLIVRIGSKVLIHKTRLMEWIDNGCPFVK